MKCGCLSHHSILSYLEFFFFSFLSQVCFLKVASSQQINIMVTVMEECDLCECTMLFPVPCILLCCAMFILYIVPVLVLVVRRANVMRDVCPDCQGTEENTSELARSETH